MSATQDVPAAETEIEPTVVPDEAQDIEMSSDVIPEVSQRVSRKRKRQP